MEAGSGWRLVLDGGWFWMEAGPGWRLVLDGGRSRIETGPECTLPLTSWDGFNVTPSRLIIVGEVWSDQSHANSFTCHVAV